MAFFGGTPGGPEILVVLVALLLLFGAKRLPQIARNLGRSMEEFKKAARDVTDEVMRAADEPPPPEPPQLEASELETSESEDAEQKSPDVVASELEPPPETQEWNREDDRPGED
jgi:sec-independent protein translocase protein TatA